MSENVIQTKNLTKVFEHEKAVDSLNLSVPQGSVFGFLGVNGAGKTTTVRMIVGHLHPTEGEAILLGKNPWKHSEADRYSVAYVSDNMHLPGWMTPEGRDEAQRFIVSKMGRYAREGIFSPNLTYTAQRNTNLSQEARNAGSACCLRFARTPMY